MDELLAITNSFSSPLSCAFCPFTADRVEYVARHVGLVHRKLDEMLSDSDLVAKKVTEFNGSAASAVVTKVEPVRKSQRTLKPVIREGAITNDIVEKPKKRKSTSESSVSSKSPVEVKVPKIEPPSPKKQIAASSSIDEESHEEDNTMLPYDYDSASNDDDDDASIADEKQDHIEIKGEPIEAEIVESPIEKTPKPKLKTVKSEPKVTIEKVRSNQDDVKPSKNSDISSVSLLKTTLLKTPVTSMKNPPPLKMPPLTSLLKPQLSVIPKSNGNSANPPLLVNSLLKRANITPKPAAVPALPPSISLTLTKTKPESLLKINQPMPKLPIKPAILDTASIADINNSWAESLLCSSGPKIMKKNTANSWMKHANPPPPTIIQPVPKPEPNGETATISRTIGSCTLTPATGKTKASKTMSSSTPTISLQKISKSTNLTPSVTLTKADPYAKSKRIKFNITPTATITPLKKGQGSLNLSKPVLFSSNSLEQNKSLSIVPAKPSAKKKKKTFEPTFPTPQVSIQPHVEDEGVEDEGIEMILEPQIMIDEEEPEEEEMEIDDNEEQLYDEMISASLENQNDNHENDEDLEEDFEFCDLCSMELEHHPDGLPCPPDEFYKREFQHCPICDKKAPLREHLAKHFIKELKDMVESFNDPLTCSQCDYQSEKTSETVALHIALNHDAINTYLKDAKLVKTKRLQYTSGKD